MSAPGRHLEPTQLLGLSAESMPPREAERVAPHLAACPDCRQRLAAVQAEEQALRRALAHQAQVPRAEARRLGRRAQRGVRRLRGEAQPWGPLLWSALGALLLLGALGLVGWLTLEHLGDTLEGAIFGR